MAAVAARGFQGVARTGLVSDPTPGLQERPPGAGPGTTPCTCPEDSGPAPATPSGRERLRWAPDFVHRRVSGQLRVPDFPRLGPLVGPVWGPTHPPGSTLAPFHPHVPGIARRHNPSHEPGWASEPQVLQ